MNRVKCLRCKGDLYFTENTCVGVLYGLSCHHCGHNHYFSERHSGKRSQAISFERLGDPVPLFVSVSKSTDHRSESYKGNLPKTHSFLKEDNPPPSKDEETVMLYEMLADGLLTEDQFNKFLVRLMMR